MTDFVVIGGGFAGISAAAHLAPHGSVVLLEMESSLAYHTSGRSAAMLVENYGSQGSRPLVKAARPFLEDPPPGAVDSPLLSPRPVLFVADTSGLADLEVKAETGRANGADNEILDADGVIEKVPAIRSDWVGGGLFEPSGADIDVAALHQAFVRIARSNGAEIITSAPVTAIQRSNDGWTVTSGNRRLSSPVVVNAAGAWGDVLARLADVEALGLQPYRRTAFMVPGSEQSSMWPMVVETHEKWYLRPDGVQFLCSLAEEVESEPMDVRPRMEDVALAIERINLATTLDIRTVNSQWTGLRTFSPDRDLVIGEDPTAPGFFWLVGLGGIGVQTSPAYGALLASLVTDQGIPDPLRAAGVDPERTSPDRFRSS
ncbi:MAG TPA: FAD-dependent oxidoreductase [Acidimicrobiia bacterium]|nr:FAD-dependent oxidoreductase [Acidimicrobiia bacterium]